VRPAEEARGHQPPRQAGVGLGTPLGVSALRESAVMAADTRQARVAGGVRVRNDPRLLVASWFGKQPCRLHGRLRVMT
jgi:hypothetical protein